MRERQNRFRSGNETRSLQDHVHLQAVDLDEAIRILKEPKRRGRSSISILGELGEHPDSGEKVQLRNGRFGPYVTDGQVNASLPKGRDPSTITLDDAVDLIANREERMRAQGKDPRPPKKSRSSGRKKRSSRIQQKRSA